MDPARWFTTGVLVVVVLISLFHLTKDRLQPPPWAMRWVTAVGWLTVIALAVYAMVTLANGEL